MAKNRRARRAPWLKKLGLLLFGCLAGLLVAEVSLRVAGISYPRFYVIDQHTGSTHHPGTVAWYHDEGEALVQINSLGMRDKECRKEKPKNTYRIAIIGDSYSEARQVDIEDTFWSVIERELKSCEAMEGKNVEALNFGVSGYGTAQHFLTLRHRALEFSPDLVVLQMCQNDVKDNSFEITGDSSRPYFVFRDGELVLDNSFRETPHFQSRSSWTARIALRLLDSSRFLQLLNDRRKKMQSQPGGEEGAGGPTNGPPIEEPFGGGSVTLYREPANQTYTDAWRVTDELLVRSRDEAVRHGADFMVVKVSSPEQVHPDAQVRQSIAESLGVDDLYYFDSRVSAVGERNGFEVLTLAKPFLAYAEEHQAFLHGFSNTKLGIGHWNEEGHRLGGEIIAKRICERLQQRGEL